MFNPQSGSLTTSSSNKRLFNYSDWLDAFFIFATVRGEAHPTEAVHMFKYMQTIKRIKDRGGNFVKYDESFRAKHKGAPTIPWGEVDPEEMLWACGDPAYTPYEKFPKGRKEKPAPHARFIASSFPQRNNYGMRPRGKCFAYNNGRPCEESTCKYDHKCIKCAGQHMAKTCKTSEKS